MGIHYKIVLWEMGVESLTHLTMHNLYYSAPRSIEFAWLSNLQAVMTALRMDISSSNRDPVRRVDIAQLQNLQRYYRAVQPLGNSP